MNAPIKVTRKTMIENRKAELRGTFCALETRNKFLLNNDGKPSLSRTFVGFLKCTAGKCYIPPGRPCAAKPKRVSVIPLEEDCTPEVLKW